MYYSLCTEFLYIINDTQFSTFFTRLFTTNNFIKSNPFSMQYTIVHFTSSCILLDFFRQIFDLHLHAGEIDFDRLEQFNKTTSVKCCFKTFLLKEIVA